MRHSWSTGSGFFKVVVSILVFIIGQLLVTKHILDSCRLKSIPQQKALQLALLQEHHQANNVPHHEAKPVHKSPPKQKRKKSLSFQEEGRQLLAEDSVDLSFNQHGRQESYKNVKNGIISGRQQKFGGAELSSMDTDYASYLDSLDQEFTPLNKNSHSIFMIISKRQSVKRRRVIRNTWARGHDNVIFLVGREGCKWSPRLREKSGYCRLREDKTQLNSVDKTREKEYQAREATLNIYLKTEPNVVLLDMEDTYGTLSRKVKLGYKWVVENTRANYIIKADDDMVVRIGSFGRYLADNSYYYTNDAYMYSGMFATTSSGNLKVYRTGKWAELKYQKEWYPKFALGSSGHMISRKIAEYIVQNHQHLVEYHGEDTSLGIWLDESPIQGQITYDPMFMFTGQAMCKSKKGKPIRKFIMGHTFKPEDIEQCYDHMDEIPKQTVVIGVGTGRCGTLEFSQLLNSQASSAVTHEWFACSGLEWDTPSYFKTKVRYDKYLSRAGDLVGDIALWNLPYVEQYLKFKNVKIVALKRNRTDTIASFGKWFKKWKHFPWLAKNKLKLTNYKVNKRYDGCYPKFEFADADLPNLKIETGATMHYDSYYREVFRLKALYPDRIRVVDSYVVLNDNNAKADLLEWLGVPPPYQYEITGKHNKHNTNQKKLNDVKKQYKRGLS